MEILNDPQTLLHEALAAQAARTPDALAVAGGGERLTYRELEARANRLARHLRTLGVGPEVRVGVCLERSADLVAGLLAVLKAGGAYVPLDPAYPGERLSFILEDSGASVVLTEERWLGVLPGLEGREPVLLDGLDLSAGSGASLERWSDPGNLAYLIYTSGSTGRPKAVAIEHRSVVVLMRWAAEVFSPSDLAGVLASTSICFDLSIFEIFAPLCLGGAVVVADSALDLPRLPPDPPVTLISTVPSVMAELVRTRRVPSSVRVANLGGEALPGSLVEEIHRATAIERVYNVYGPSEDTTYSTYALIPCGSRATPPVGHPLPGTRIWLLDAEGMPVPFGEEGEVCLSGAGLSRGYFGRPDLTAERFLPDPWSGEPGARLYRVGDLGRFLPDGQLHYVGRIDFQVKVRGFRVELGEVEDALMRHPAVREAAVAARGEVAEGMHLVAWLVADGPVPGTGELRSFLGETLPAYMIPSLFVRLEALPRTLNGKVDRKALPEPGQVPAATPVPEGLLPLSFAQQRLWFLERLRPGEPTYNEPAAFDLRGPVDPAALAASLGEVVRRHAVLRTRYVEAAAVPFQEVCDAVPLELPLVDLGALPEAVRGEELARGVRQEVRRPFDLGRPPLLRATLFRTGGGEHTLALTVHHIAYDGRSKEILARELSVLYAAALAGGPSPLPEPACQYGDLALRQRESWRGIPPARLAEWRRLLEGAPVLELPANRPRPPVATSRGETLHFRLAPHQVSRLRAVAQAEGATLFRTLLAVFAALLGRASGQRDGVLGTTAAGRTLPESRDLIGFFVNLLPLRVDLSGSPSLRGLLARIRSLASAAAAAQEDLPFEQLVAALQPERSAGRGALFQVLFQLHPPLAVPALEGLEVEPRAVDTGTAKFDLETTLFESGRGIEGFCQASADLYDRSTVFWFAERFQALLGAALTDPDRPLDEVPLFSRAELQQLVVRRAAGAAARPVPPAGMAGTAGMAEITELLAQIWCEVLGLASVGARDNFFHLGGHSLLGARVLSRVRDAFAVDLPVQVLFQDPTVEGLARAVAGALRGGGRPALPPVQPMARAAGGGLQPPSFAQERFWFLHRLEPGSAVYNIPLALRLLGPLDGGALEAAMREIVRRHEALRTRFVEVAGQLFQEVVPAADLEDGIGLPRIDLTAVEAREELARLCREQAAERFDLGRAPLARARLVCLGAGDHALLMTFHHAAFDGWSQGLFNRELSALYTAALEDRPSPLAEPPVQYADFAAWQRSWLTGEVLDGLLAAWRRELEGAPTAVELPADRPRPDVQSFRGARERVDLPASLGEEVAALARCEGATRFMVLLAAFQALLHGLTGEEDLLVGSPVASRPRAELEGIIGLFVDTLVLRGRLGGDPPFRGLLARVRETALWAYAHQDLPFERLVAGLRVERSPVRNPLIQVLFSLQEAPGEGLVLAGLSARELETETATAKLDLSLMVEETRAGGLRAILEYDTSLFEAATARRCLHGFLAVLADALGDPTVRLSALPRMSEAERGQLRHARPGGARERVGIPAVAARDTAGEAPGMTPTAARVARIWCQVLGLDAVGPRDDFFLLGGHSLLGARVLSRVRDAFGVDLPIRELFRAPTVAELAAVIDAAERGWEPSVLPPVLPVPRDGRPLPLSFAQEALWFIHLLGTAGALYNVSYAWHLSGPLHAAALQAALGEVVRRHEALRTRLVETGGQPFQEISAPAPVALLWTDLSDLIPGAAEAEVARLAREEAGTRFDLGQGPLVRARLIGLGLREHVLLLTAHHTVFDGWSEGIFNREIAAFYESAISGSPARVAGLPVQYADFAVWQRSWLAGEELERLLAYWRRELAGAPAVLDLPTDRPRQEVQAFQGARERLDLKGLAEPVHELARRERATPFIVLLAVFQTLLHRLADQDDVLVGSPVANRPLPELEGLIGCFVGTVVLRGRFDGEAATLRGLLARVRETALGAYAHAGLPFERLVAELQVERALSHNPLFQAMLAFGAPVTPLALAGVEARRLDLVEPPAMFDLTLDLVESGGGLTGLLEYDAGLFDRGTARRLLEGFAILLEAALADPERRLDEIPLLTGAELAELAAAGRAAGLRGGPGLLHGLFTAQAARAPQALAVLTAEGERLTFAELDGRSDRLARSLRRRGIGPEVPVGVCLERTPELIVALLGVLKAGGVYLPLDPAYPAQRLAFMLEDSGAPLALTLTRLAPVVPAGPWEVLSLDEPGEDAGSPAPERVVPGNLAYLIYTSGSTGRPKGVGVSHAAAAAHMETVAGLFGLAGGDRFLQFSSPSFDMSLEEILVPLIRGAAVVLREADLWQPVELPGRLANLGVTAVNLPTAYWHQWAAESEHARPSAATAGSPLRLVVLGGEAMSGEMARRWWRSSLAGPRLLNGYGPTEAVITATALEVGAQEAAAAAGVVPIGRPLEGRAAWVLDRRGQPVPSGMAGELCLGGPLLARGYAGRPDLTAERLVPDPFSGEPGARLYRTGDRVRRRPDGVLEFLGRVDRQIKVRGFRIEPGEVEAALARHPRVAQAVVDAREAASGGLRLVAWTVPAAGQAPTAAELAEHLSATLPGHMVPSAFVALAELPLTPNGKVDRRALPAPEETHGAPREAAPPHTPTEELLAGVWAGILGVPAVSTGDHFFALGGHSLLAVQLLSRIREVFGVEVSLRDLFASPVLADQAGRIDAALRGAGGLAAPPLVRRARPERPPLSFAQHRLWLLERLQPSGAAYNLVLALRLSGPLDPAALAVALAGVVDRHEVLRTRFSETAGGPWQEVLPAWAPALPVIDFGSVPAALRDEALRQLAQAAVRQPFDLAAAPPLRACLLRLEPGEHLFLLTLHHAVSDGLSQDILRRELAALYTAAAEGRPSPLPGLALQYADYALWQREWLGGETLAEQLLVWRRRLAGVPALELPTDRPRPAVWTFRGAVHSAPLSADLAAALHRLARREGATPFMVVLAAFQTLLGRTSGQDDFAVGSPSANRRPEVEGMVGFFVNMLPLRASLSGAPAFRGLLARVREAALEAYGHQDLPFERLVEELAPERDLGRNPVFQVTFQLFHEAPPPAFAGLATAAVDPGTGTAKFDLSLEVVEGGGGLTAVWEYATDLFDAATVRRLAGHLGSLLAGALAAPETGLEDLPWLGAAERHQLLLEWNDTTGEPLQAEGVHRLVAQQARRRPEALAVAAGGEELTYGELVHRAGLLARRLRGLGAGPEVLVGVCLERSPELIVALLAVLEAGAAYLPLDPSLPHERLDFLLADSRAAVVVGRRGVVAGWQPAGVPCLWLDGEDAAAPAGPGGDATPAVLEGLAYVIYTSGSTGLPKGVEVGHRSLLNLVAWHLSAFGLTAADRSTQVAQIGFDASVWEVWPVLAAGASLHLPDDAVRTAPELLRDWLVEEGITVSFLPTPLAEGVLALEWQAGTPLRILLTGGDRLRQPPAPSLPFTLVNNYGPTEATVVATSGAVPARSGGGPAPAIGRPIFNGRVHVLDAAGRPVPVGVAGELYVGGAGLARGYRGRPELTAERFVPDPLSGMPGGRLYRTGDRVRLRPQGDVEFLGRTDHQIKVRGFRIEPGEIEAALLRHPGVGECAVAAREGASGDARLVAWIVPAGLGEGEELPAAGLRDFLSARLPAYMVPSAFVTLPSLPLTATGKVDRRALPAPAEEAGEAPGSFRDPVEEVIAGLWMDLLGAGRIGPHDDFFAMGGHSLRATQLASRLRQAFDVDLPLRAVFEAPTVARLAERVRNALGSGRRALLPPIVREARPERIPLSFAQQRLWFLDLLEPDRALYNIPTAVTLAGPLDAAALEAAFTGVIHRHETLRTRILNIGGLPWQEIAGPGPVLLPWIDLEALPAGCRAAELDRLAREDARRPFDLSRGPLLRGALIRLAEEEHALLFTTHHIVSDAWSEDILRRELSVLYAAALAGRPSLLPELPVQYADFALWQRRWPAELLDSQLEYWRAKLDGLAVLELPTDRPRPPVQAFHGAIEPVGIPARLVAALRDLARHRGATLFMTLLAAWQTLMGRLSGQADVAVGSPMANRNRAEIEGLIGFFINMLAYRGDLGGDPSFEQLLARIGRTALDAYEHRDVPFERLVDELRPERDLSRQPLVQVMIALQDTDPEALVFPGAAVAPLDSGNTVAKFDLTLYLEAEGSGLAGAIEYCTDLFDRATILRLSGHLMNILETVAARPGVRLSEIGLLTPAERHQLLREWNDTRAPYPEEVLLHQFFEAQVDRAPGALAAVWQGSELTYGELEARANQIANLLLGRGLRRGQPVGVWMERSFDMVASVLAILKAGGYYLPLDGVWPAERVEGILRTSAAPAVLTRSAHLAPVLEMRWRLPALADVICLDEEDPAPPPEPVDAEGVRALFDLVAERAVDRVTAGGFVSSFTGEPFSEAEVDEYRDRVIALASPWLGAGRRVLEIGCGSGLLLWEMAPRVSRCVGLDPSPLTQERNRAEARRRGLGQVELPVGFAHEVESWPDASFDLVLLASTAQFFPGPLYLERIVAHALRLLAPGGALLIADVPDARRQEELRRALEEHHAGTGGLPPRPDILSLDEDLFRDLATLPGVDAVFILHREHGFDNELRFRYDVLMTRSPAPVLPVMAGERPRRKAVWTSWHVDRRPGDRPPAVAAPDDLAYVIYTSGSTGQPKGITVQHRPVANLVDWLNRAFDIGADDRVLFVTSLCFDLSVYDIFGLLAAGGCVHVASEEELRDPERLVRMLLDEPITLWDSAPAALVRLAPLFPAQPAEHSRLRRVMLSGDWIPVTLPDRVRAAFPGAEVTSLGGGTEATIWSNFYPVGEVDPRWPSIPYGRPIHNAIYHVLDAGLEPCPVGVPGDLYIGGDVLCTGYAGQPAVTAVAFIPDPFAGTGRAGARLYRTGDRARYFADGNLEFLGRIDHQVKIRGFRIELGEIEVALVRHPRVREAVVLARGEAGDKRLVAYVVPPVGETAPGRVELRDFLRRSLPDYMTPSAFVPLAALPVTPNGKLDRRALPAPGRETAREETAALPKTPTEQTLAALWSELLGIERVEVSDNFFELGGHSLLATQLVARLRETFATELPLRTLFLTPTLSALATALDATLPSAAVCPIRPVPRQGELPLSASQLRQWFLVQLEPESLDYNLPLAFRLAGPLRPEVLGAALREIVRRHETLRTTFTSVAGRPAAVVSPEAVLPLPVLDLSALPEGARQAAASRITAEEHDRPFDLTPGPLLRALLIRLSAGEHLLAATVHHIVFDGWSLGVFLTELAVLYEAFAAGQPSPLPELPVQYADYAAWQREWLASPGLDTQLAFWKETLAGSSPALDLPTDRPRSAVQTHRGELLPLAVPPDLAAGLKTLAAREGVTLFMALLAGYATLLSRYTGQEDLNVGTFVANRRWEALERLIGFFVNTLVLRADLTGGPGFRELLARVRDTTLDAFDHQEVPIERLLDELDTGRDLSRPPLFQVMFGVQNFAVPDQDVPGLSIQAVEVAEHSRINADLAFWMWEQGEGLTGWLQFSTDLYDGATVQRMFGHMLNLLAAAVADPSLHLSALPLLSLEEQRQILDWSVSPAPPEAPRLVHERMREQAHRAPEAPAVTAGVRTLTYGELDRRSGLVARGLRRLGAGPETVVGLAIDRSPEMIVALYGILRAGAAYLPLDPKLPAGRLALLMEDAGVTGVLTRRSFAAELPSLPARVLLVDADFEDELEGEEAAVLPESAAYVLYTSGSTGTPKGVAVEHRALAAFVEAALETYGIGPGDRVLQFASLSFDTSVEEIYPCLAAGGTLVLRDDEMIASPARFLDACGEAGVTVLDLPTAYWHELAAVPGGAPPLPDTLRLVILGGERVLPERVRGWLAATGPRPRLLNTYGPTEGTVVVTACDLGETAPDVPIGRPLRGVAVHLLDRALGPAPAGVAGEICLGGGALARGYLGRPDLTAERFVPSPFGPPGARLYRTGDLGRWQAGGQIGFAGRVDDQIKIRGFRVEPGEIAAVLARHPAVGEAFVAAWESGPGERRLAAYAVPVAEPWPAVAELRAFLKEELPAYMVPPDLVLLEALPLTPTGKVDRRALPEPGAAGPLDGVHEPPSTLTEELIAAIWQELLGVERVGAYDNFFDLGGHSLLAPQVLSRMEDTFEVQMPLRTLFESPTVAQMANAVERILLEQIESLNEEEAAGLAGGERL